MTSMRMQAPKDRNKNSAKINWLLRQVKNIDPKNVFVKIDWSRSTADEIVPLEKLVSDPKMFDSGSGNKNLGNLEISLVSDSGQRFAGRKKFIEELEMLVPTFYERVGQHLKPWRPQAPKVKAAENDSENPRTKNKPEPTYTTTPKKPGNEHTKLLDIPWFLRKVSR